MAAPNTPPQAERHKVQLGNKKTNKQLESEEKTSFQRPLKKNMYPTRPKSLRCPTIPGEETRSP